MISLPKNALAIVESFLEMSRSVALLQTLQGKRLLKELALILDSMDIGPCKQRMLCCFLKVITDRAIFKNHEEMIFDLFMSHEPLYADWKLKICRKIIDNTTPQKDLIEIFSNLNEERFQNNILSQEHIREKIFIRYDGELIYATLNNIGTEEALAIYYPVKVKKITKNLLGHALRWLALSPETTDHIPQSMVHNSWSDIESSIVYSRGIMR
ncbi:MAG: hypothetical protein V1753_11630 [Pseudomonadota bacterium]